MIDTQTRLEKMRERTMPDIMKGGGRQQERPTTSHRFVIGNPLDMLMNLLHQMQHAERM